MKRLLGLLMVLMIALALTLGPNSATFGDDGGASTSTEGTLNPRGSAGAEEDDGDGDDEGGQH